MVGNEEEENVGLGGRGDEVGGEVDAVFLGLFAVVVFEGGGYDLWRGVDGCTRNGLQLSVEADSGQ